MDFMWQWFSFNIACVSSECYLRRKGETKKTLYVLERSRKGTERSLCVESSLWKLGFCLLLAVQSKRKNELMLLQPGKLNFKGVWVKNVRTVSQ